MKWDDPIDDIKAATANFATSSPVQSISDRQSQLERDMQFLTTKVAAIDSKLDLLLSILIPGHDDDAKKGDKLNVVQDRCSSGFKAHKDNEHEGDDGNTERETSDAAVNVTSKENNYFQISNT